MFNESKIPSYAESYMSSRFGPFDSMMEQRGRGQRYATQSIRNADRQDMLNRQYEQAPPAPTQQPTNQGPTGMPLLFQNMLDNGSIGQATYKSLMSIYG